MIRKLKVRDCRDEVPVLLTPAARSRYLPQRINLPQPPVRPVPTRENQAHQHSIDLWKPHGLAERPTTWWMAERPWEGWTFPPHDHGPQQNYGLRPNRLRRSSLPILPRSLHRPRRLNRGQPHTESSIKMGCGCGPLPPSISTVKSVAATRSMRSRTRRIASLAPISGAAPSIDRFSDDPNFPLPMARSSSSTMEESCVAASIS